MTLVAAFATQVLTLIRQLEEIEVNSSNKLHVVFENIFFKFRSESANMWRYQYEIEVNHALGHSLGVNNLTLPE